MNIELNLNRIKNVFIGKIKSRNISYSLKVIVDKVVLLWLTNNI